MNHSHYYKDVTHLKSIDVYRVLRLFNVTDPCLQHAIKKLLAAGGRGAGKDFEKDVREAGDSINRCLQMIAEDCNTVASPLKINEVAVTLTPEHTRRVPRFESN